MRYKSRLSASNKLKGEIQMGIYVAAKYVFWLFLYSFIGWVYESILCSVSARRWINRGFLNGPYCPIYGWGALLVILILGKIKNPLLIFLLGMLVTCSLEYFSSYLMEKLFHARWWDYSARKFNINGRVCLIGAIVFGSFSVILIKFIHPMVLRLTNSIPNVPLCCISAIVGTAMLIDLIVTLRGFAGFDTYLKELSATIEKLKDELTDKHLDPFVKRLSRQQKRMVNAFPKLRSMHYDGPLSRIRKIISQRKDINGQ